MRLGAAAVAVLIVLLAPGRSSAQADTVRADSTRRVETRFFHNRPYGTDAEFNPLSVLVYEGFDQLRTSPRSDIFHYPFGSSFKAVLRSVVHPDRSIARYGYRNWLRDEIFPVTLKRQGGGQWYPNYTLHLFGSGVTYMRLADWYRLHGVADHAELAAGMSTFAYHLLNEAVENGPTADRGVDALSDLLVFDVASIVLWNQRWTQHLFSGPLEVNTWPGQASFGVPGRTIENAYSMVILRAPIPRSTNWRLLITHGNQFLVGLSRRTGGDMFVSLGGGADAPANPIIDPSTGKKTATLEPNAGLFVDRGGSLLASLVSRGGSNNGVTLNVYPGVLDRGDWSPGLWVQQNKGGGVRFGISSRVGIGLSTHAGIR